MLICKRNYTQASQKKKKKKKKKKTKKNTLIDVVKILMIGPDDY